MALSSMIQGEDDALRHDGGRCRLVAVGGGNSSDATLWKKARHRSGTEAFDPTFRKPREAKHDHAIRSSPVPRRQCRGLVDSAHTGKLAGGGRRERRRACGTGGQDRCGARYLLRRNPERSLSMDGEFQGLRVAAVLEGTERAYACGPGCTARPSRASQT